MLGTIKAKQNFNRKIRKKNFLSLNHHQLPGRVAIPSLLNGLSVSPVSQSCPTLCDQMDCSPPGSSVYGIFQASILEWVAISYSRRSSQPRDRTHVSCDPCTGRWMLYHCARLTAFISVLPFSNPFFIQQAE